MGIPRNHLEVSTGMDVIEATGPNLYVCFQLACTAPEAEKQEYMQKLEMGLMTFHDHVERIKITPFIEDQLARVPAGSSITDNLDKFCTAFNTTFTDLNECIPQDQQINGLPGTNILNSFLMRKALGENVNAQTLQLELSQNNLIRNENLCNMVDVLATYYIDNCLEFKPDKAPNLYSQPPEL